MVADTFLHGVRTPWRDAPPQVQDWVLSRTGALCGEPRDCVGGMATGVAAVVTGTDRSVFVKAIDAAENPHGGQMYRRQVEIADRLPGHRTIPALLDHELIEIGDRAWQIVLTSARPGVTPHHPWRRADLDRVLAAWQDLRPVLAATPWPESGHFSKFFVGWRKIAERSDDPWNAYARHWVGRETAMADAVDGGAGAVLGHGDPRADNIVLGDEPREVAFVDWAQPGTSAPWLDVALLMADVVASGGCVEAGGDIDVVATFADAYADTDPEIVIAVTAGLAAAMHSKALEGVIPARPHGHTWQVAVSEWMLPFIDAHLR